jgi:hypothetical protein
MSLRGDRRAEVKTKQNFVAAAAAVAVVGGALLVNNRMEKVRKRIEYDARRWHIITVNLPLPEVAAGTLLPEPLERLGAGIEVEIRPAPGDKGTEIAARLLLDELGEDESPRRALQELRRALRNTQWLLETGEILSPDKPPSTRRTPLNIPLELATRFARAEGRL